MVRGWPSGDRTNHQQAHWLGKQRATRIGQPLSNELLPPLMSLYITRHRIVLTFVPLRLCVRFSSALLKCVPAEVVPIYENRAGYDLHQNR